MLRQDQSSLRYSRVSAKPEPAPYKLILASASALNPSHQVLHQTSAQKLCILCEMNYSIFTCVDYIYEKISKLYTLLLFFFLRNVSLCLMYCVHLIAKPC